MTDTNKLAELIKKAKSKMWGKTFHSELERNMFVADYLLANGVIVPKFNVGDTVWYITGIHRTIVKSAIVEEIIINGNGVSDLYVKNDMGGYFENSVEIFYSTKEEAEEKLKELKTNDL